MFDIYCTDIIRIVETRYDKYGNLVEIESDDIPAKIEDENKLIRIENGKEIRSNMLINFEYDNIILPQYKIKVREKNNNEFYMPDKKWEILSLSKNGMFEKMYCEVRI